LLSDNLFTRCFKLATIFFSGNHWRLHCEIRSFNWSIFWTTENWAAFCRK
jgi:hypothetical protein